MPELNVLMKCGQNGGITRKYKDVNTVSLRAKRAAELGASLCGSTA